METLRAFLEEVQKEQRATLEWRRTGQIMMSVLCRMDVNLYSEITQKGDCDPFYADSKIPAFLNILVEAWGE